MLSVGRLDYLKGLFQPKCFCDYVVLNHTFYTFSPLYIVFWGFFLSFQYYTKYWFSGKTTDVNFLALHTCTSRGVPITGFKLASLSRYYSLCSMDKSVESQLCWMQSQCIVQISELLLPHKAKTARSRNTLWSATKQLAKGKGKGKPFRVEAKLNLML